MAKKTKQVVFKLPEYMYTDLQGLKRTLRLEEDSKVMRFCITYTLMSIEKIDENQISTALAVAISDALFGNGNDKKSE
jgi:hypothetical protein